MFSVLLSLCAFSCFLFCFAYSLERLNPFNVFVQPGFLDVMVKILKVPKMRIHRNYVGFLSPQTCKLTDGHQKKSRFDSIGVKKAVCSIRKQSFVPCAMPPVAFLEELFSLTFITIVTLVCIVTNAHQFNVFICSSTALFIVTFVFKPFVLIEFFPDGKVAEHTEIWREIRIHE